MKEYLNLQIKLTGRKFREIGIHPILAIVILSSLLIALTIYLFEKTEFAPYIIALLAILFTTRLSEIKRIEFLKLIFKAKQYTKVRIMENLIISAPFLIILLFYRSYFAVLIVLALALILALKNIKTTYHFTIPTPYFKNPFEFLTGFRRTFYLIPLAYILAIISISVNNFNLGVFSFLLAFIIYFSYYFKPEDEYYVWSFNLSTKSFLLSKIKIALLQASYFVLPLVLVISFFYLSEIWTILLFLVIGYAFLIFFILAKYSTYPDEIGIIQGIILVLCIFFPPILLVIIPVLFSQSQKRLNYLLQ
ncbi:MAG: ABC transporter permease [Brumimicrobium sp.]|nr:ABC transporter permease [Brumimicrobium sp.]